MRKLLLLFSLAFSLGIKAQSNYAVSLDGTNDYVVSQLNGSGYSAITIEMWLNPTASSGDPLQWRPTSGPPMLWKYLNGTLEIYQGGGYYFPTTIPTGKWTHIALTWNGTTWTLYKNGISQGTQTAGWPNQGYAAIDFRIGGSSDWWGYFNGKIDEVRVWNTARTQSEIVTNMGREISGSSTGLQMYLNFNDGSGTNANDATSNNIDGTLTNGPTWVSSGIFTPSNIGNALSFDGTGDYVSIPDNAAIDFGSSTDFTLEAWIKLLSSASDYDGIVVKGGSGTNWYGYQLVLVGNKLAAEINDNSATPLGVSAGLQGTSNLNDGKWHHVAMVVSRSSTNIKLFVDGNQEANVTNARIGNNLDNAANMFIGVERTPILYTNAIIDEVRVWNTARSQSQLSANMYTVIDPSTSNLVAYYRFDIGSANGTNTGLTTLPDLTSNKNDGTLNTFSLSGSTSNYVAGGAYNTWTGSTNTTWSTAGNWYTGSAPGTTEYVIIPSSSEASNQPALGANTSVGGINNSGIITIGSNTLTINGSCTGSGTLKGSSTSNLTIGTDVGTLYFDQTTPGTTNVIQNLVIGSGSAASMTIGNALNIAPAGSVTFNASGTKSLTTGGYLTLKSSASGTAYIGNSNSATLSGNITVERYIPSRRAYRFLASPVTTTNGIDDNWQQQTHITGTGTGFDATVNNNPSMFTLNESSQSWTAITNTQTSNLTQGVGYRLFVRGDRTINLANNSASPTAVTLSATGSHTSGDKTYNTGTTPAISGTTNNYTFLGNPFPSSIDWNAISRTNVSTTYYTWKSQGGTNSRGVYVNFNATGSVSSDGNINQYIGSGSGFMIQTTGASPSITIEEQDKVSNDQGSMILGKTANPNTLRVTLLEDDSVFADGFVIYQNDEANDNMDAFDSEKWINPGISMYSLTNDGKKVSIQGFKNLVSEKVVYLGMEKTEKKTYKLSFSEMSNLNAEAVLIDKFTNNETIIKSNPVYSFTVNDDPNSSAIDRFKIAFRNAASGVKELNAENNFIVFPNPANEKLYVNLTTTKEGEYQYVIFDQLGSEVYKGMNDFAKEHLHSIQIESLRSGVYFLKVFNSNGNQTIKFIK